MSSSTAPAAKAAILALLEAHAPLDDVNLRWGGPTKEAQLKPDQVFFGQIEQTEEPLGPHTIDEDYDLEIVVQVRKLGDDKEQATEERAWDIRSEIRAALEANPTLGGLLNIGCEISRTVQESEPLTDGWFARLRLTVHCHSHLTDY